jgi:hypothetical protein
MHQRWIHIGAIAELNFEILQHQCIFSWTDRAFYSNVQAYFWLPIVTAALLAMVYGGMVLVHQHAPQYRRLTPQRRGELLKRLRQRVIALGCCLFNLMCVTSHTNVLPVWALFLHARVGRIRLSYAPVGSWARNWNLEADFKLCAVRSLAVACWQAHRLVFEWPGVIIL